MHAVPSLIPSGYFFKERGKPNSDADKALLFGRVFKPRANAEPFPLTFPIDWSAAASATDRNWRMHLHGWTMLRPAFTCFDACSSDEKATIVAYMLDIARDWYNKYGNDSDTIVTTRMPKDYAWYDMSVGFRALTLAFFRNRIACDAIALSDEDASLLNALAQKHMRHLMHPKTFSLNNHGIVQMHGLYALQKTSRNTAPANVARIAEHGMERLVRSQFDERGIHIEHSPYYHIYTINAFATVLSTGWYSAIDATLLLEKAKKNIQWLVDPNRCPACIGDSTLGQQTVRFDAHTPEGARYVSSDFDASGYHIIRSAWEVKAEQASYLFFMAAYHSKTHKHRDCLSFEWFERGRKIICDGGKYAYASDAKREYCLSPSAHNSVEIDGFDILKMKPYGSALQETGMIGDHIFMVKAVIKDPEPISKARIIRRWEIRKAVEDYFKLSHTRYMYYRPGRWVILRDKLTAARSRNFTQWTHTEKGYVPVSVDGSRLLYRHDDDGGALIIHCLTPNVSCSTYYGDNETLKGFISETTYSFIPTQTVGFSATGTEGEFLTVLALSPEDEADALRSIVKHDIAVLPASVIIPPPTSELLPNIPHYDCDDVAMLKDALRPGKATYRLASEAGDILCYAHIKDNADNLTVLLPGAVHRDRRTVDFQRYSWSDDMDGHVISVADPTLTEDNTLSIGWFQGTHEHYAMDRAEALVRACYKALHVPEHAVCVFGSSAGGFSALQLVTRFPEATALAINPQIYIYNYSKRFFDPLLTYSYPDMDFPSAHAAYRDRLSVHVHTVPRTTPIFIMQNTEDEHHVKRHIGYYAKKLPTGLCTQCVEGADSKDEDALINISYYNDPVTGHAPPDKETTLAYIRDARERAMIYRQRK